MAILCAFLLTEYHIYVIAIFLLKKKV